MSIHICLFYIPHLFYSRPVLGLHGAHDHKTLTPFHLFCPFVWENYVSQRTCTSLAPLSKLGSFEANKGAFNLKWNWKSLPVLRPQKPVMWIAGPSQPAVVGGVYRPPHGSITRSIIGPSVHGVMMHCIWACIPSEGCNTQFEKHSTNLSSSALSVLQNETLDPRVLSRSPWKCHRLNLYISACWNICSATELQPHLRVAAYTPKNYYPDSIMGGTKRCNSIKDSTLFVWPLHQNFANRLFS